MLVSSEIAFRGNIPEVRDISNYRQTPVPPLPGWNSLANHIQFVIPTSEQEWLSSQFVLDYDFSIQLSDDSDIPPNALVAFTDLPIASQWQSVKLQINGTIIEGLNSDWAMRSWISSILSMNRTAKDFYGKDLFKAYSDDPFKSQSKLDNENSGWRQRRLLAGSSQWCHVRCPIPFSFSSSGLALPPNTPVTITLVNADNAQRIISADADGEAYRLQIHEIRLLATYMTLSDHAERSLAAKLSIGNLRYPYLSCELLSTNTLPQGTRQATLTLTRGDIPELVLFALLKTSLTENNYHSVKLEWLQRNWQDLNNEPLELLQCFCNGLSYPSDGYTMNFEDLTNTSGLYEAFIEICRLMSGDGSFSFSQWQGGRNLIPVQLTQHYPSTKYSNPKKRGELTVKLRFRAQLLEAYNLYSFTIASTQLTISRDRSIHFE